MRLPRPTSSAAPVHFVWLLGATCFLFAGVIWSGTQAHAVELSPMQQAEQDATHVEAQQATLLGRLQLAGIATRRAGPHVVAERKVATAAPAADEQELALARYTAAVGVGPIQSAVATSGSQLAAEVLGDERITLVPGARYDIEAGRVDPRVLALLSYLAEAHGEVTVSCLITGHSRLVAQTKAEKKRKAPRRVSAHWYGRAVDISSIGGVPVFGNQQPGGLVEQAVEDILALPPSLQPSEVISLLSLSGPSFRLPDHADHLHIGY